MKEIVPTNLLIVGNYGNAFKGTYYSGASDISQEGKYVWCTTNRAYNASNLRFFPGQPDNNLNSQHCAIAHVSPGAVTQYDDVGCETVLPYICEVNK
jgi:hypothetical protein